jgi:hypothetical protein
MGREEAGSCVTPAARAQARVAGGLYILIILGGLFAEAVVLGRLTTFGDPTATAQAIAANVSLWRLGLGVHLAYLACAAPVMYVLLYRLFRHRQEMLAQMALAFALTSAAVEGAALLQLYVPLALVESRSAVGALGEGRDALAYLAVRLYEAGFGFALLFFAGFCSTIGVVLVRSGLVPRILGWFMVAAGVCYFVSSLATVLAPATASLLFPWILLPCLVGEASLALWLLIGGIKEPPQKHG